MLAEAVAPVIVYRQGHHRLSAKQAVMDAMVRVANLIGASDSERRGLLSVKGEANSLAAALLGLDEAIRSEGSQGGLRRRR